jgi:hypothetical protein
MDDVERKTEGLGDISLSATLSFINPMWTSPGSNMGFHNEKSVAIRLNSVDTSPLAFKRRIKSVCHMQALLGAHQILHIFRIRVKLRLFSKSQKNVMKYK